MLSQQAQKYLPDDGFTGLLIARVWHTDSSGVAGPSPVLIKEHGVFNLSAFGSTMAELINNTALHSICQRSDLVRIGNFEDILNNTLSVKSIKSCNSDKAAKFIAPVDLQAIKACGVTFVCSMLERVIEEQAGGDAIKAKTVREKINASLDSDLSKIVPGSAEAEKLKTALIKEGMWSQYLEVGIGPDAEVFTKSQPLSSMGLGDEVGINRISTWNNPEPEVVLLVNNSGEIKGATLGNDVNLRDYEGRSALLLGKAKDNNAASSIGPLIRLFDDTFCLTDVEQCEVSLTISGTDGFVASGKNLMAEISRSPQNLVDQTLNDQHQYPDGMMLYVGTMFAPTEDRHQDGNGFTHLPGDRVEISTPKLGTLVNWVNHCDAIPPWNYGVNKFIQYLRQCR